MDDIAINNLAMDIISSITRDLNESLYSNISGTLSVNWVRDGNFNASAQSISGVNQPPVHRINMHFELVRQLFRDIEEYCDYVESECDKAIFDELFKDDPEYKEILPSNFAKADYRKNIFISSLTWVFFHELAHLNQEHGHIRSQVLESDNYLIHECNINNSKMLEGEAAAISHTTEMAADFEAVCTCITELIRHFKGNDLEDSVGTFVCALSCAIYKIHGTESLSINPKPEGTHPPPIVRLEHILPQIWEIFSLPSLQSKIGVNLSRSELVHLCDRIATTVGLFWSRKHLIVPEKWGEFLHAGTINKTEGKEYMRIIINTWDEIEPEISRNKRFNNTFSLLTFTEQYRNLVFETVDKQ